MSWKDAARAAAGLSRIPAAALARSVRWPAPVPALAAALAVAALLSACTTIDPPKPGDPYPPRTSEINVLRFLEVAYTNRQVDRYAEMLADDFQFYFDPGTRDLKGLPPFWNRTEDSTSTGRLFLSPAVTGIRITLTVAGGPRADNRIGHERWTRIDVTDTFLEVDLAAGSEHADGLTMRVDGQTQEFYFRKGRNPADTDTATSDTAKLYYLVEWRDHGMQ